MPDDIENTGLSPGSPEKTQSPKEKLKEITDGIERGIKELFASDRYADYLKTMSRFHNYSLNNIMLIYMQKPNATMVAGFGKWKDQFGRHVNKGEKGIKIISPVLYNKKVEREKRDPQTQMLVVDEKGEPIMEEITIRIPRFKVTSVFDVSQTEGKPLPTLIHDLYGNVENYDVFMEAIRRSSPAPMDIVPLSQEEHGDGYYSLNEKHIYLRAGMSQVQTVSAAIHEMAHAMLHSKEMLEAEKLEAPDAKPKSKAQKEIEAESVSYACCQYYGIETKDNSFGYIVNWSKDQQLSELKASLDTVNRTASAIITTIDRNLKEIVHERTAQQQAQEQEKAAVPAALEDQEAPFAATGASITPAGLLMPDCGVSITQQDLVDYGYPNNDLLPLTKEKAYTLFDQDAAVFALYENGSADMMASPEEIKAHDGYFGVEYADWKMTPDYQDRLARHLQETARLEQFFLTKMGEPAAMIYQLLPDDSLRDHLFTSLGELEKMGHSVERQHYEPIYAMTIPTVETKPDQILEGIFHQFNMNRPDDFRGHSMSVSDIIALKVNGEVSFHYVDSFGFKRLDGFLRDNPLKNAEMSVEDDYGMIDGIVNNGKAPALEEQKKDAFSKKDEPVSILARLEQPLPARNPRDHDKPKKNKEMEL